ncbi:MAG: ricin-type beta-trefoil lectin domain protein [Bauldia sp.]
MNTGLASRYWKVLSIGAVLLMTGEVALQSQPFGVPVPIVNVQGRCLDVAGAVNANAVNVQIWDCNGTTAQVWTFQPGGQIRNTMGRCLDVAGAVNANGTNVQIWDCNGSVAQIWNVAPGGAIRNTMGRCLDVAGAGNANGVNVQIWDCNGTLAQIWNIPTAPPPPPTPVVHSQGTFQLTPQQQVNLDNGVVGGAGADLNYAVAQFNRQLAPVNGAQISFTNGAQRGYAGCSTASYGTSPVPQSSLPVGSFVCVRTSEGRFSEFRVEAVGNILGVLTLRYTTWQ